MKLIRIAPDPSIEDLALLALSVHNAVGGMPIVMKARDRAGILIEDGEFFMSPPECQSLECLFKGDRVRQIYIDEGRYSGATMFASAIINGLGHRIAAIGVIDTLGILSLERFVADSEHLDRQLNVRRPRK
jgi:hypothetical protein